AILDVDSNRICVVSHMRDAQTISGARPALGLVAPCLQGGVRVSSLAIMETGTKHLFHTVLKGIRVAWR
ncbi:hypothetical protein, partial [Roseovarius sp.]|uniref:hypothetical protein n=1 Tax=Roseovarius sp. TaxID=1486281 RepID=UPI003562270A